MGRFEFHPRIQQNKFVLLPHGNVGKRAVPIGFAEQGYPRKKGINRFLMEIGDSHRASTFVIGNIAQSVT